MQIILVVVIISVFKFQLNFGIDQDFCQRTCGCTNPNNILEVIPLTTNSVTRTKRQMGAASFGQPWSPWASSGPQNYFQHPWSPSSPFIPKGGSKGTFNSPWTVGVPWLQGSKGMADSSYIPRPGSSANIYNLPKKFIPVETRRDKKLIAADGFILMRRHNKTAKSSGYSSAGGRKVQGSGGILGKKAGQGVGGSGPLGNKAGFGVGGGKFGNKAGQGMAGGNFGNKAGQGMAGGNFGNKAGPGINGAPGNKAGPKMGGASGSKPRPGGDNETFIKKDGKLVEF